MSDVNIKYNGASIATMDASGTKTCETSGKYCEGNITVEYTDPEKPTQTKSMALGAAAPATVSPDSGKVLSSVTPSIDTSVIKAANIAQGATILGVAGSHAGQKTEQSKTVTPNAAGQTVTPDSGKVLSSVVINGDADLVADNVRSGVNIFGVTGNLTPGITPSGTKSITTNGTHDVTNYASASVNVQPDNFRQWTYVSDGAPHGGLLISNDPWLAAHRTDSNLVVILRPKFVPTYGSGLRSILQAVGSNSPFNTSIDSTYYGFFNRLTTDTGGMNSYPRKYDLTHNNDLGDFQISSSGTLTMIDYNSTIYCPQAGEWSITAYLM